MNTKVWQTLAVAAIASIAVAGSVQADSFTIYGTGNNGAATGNDTVDTNFTLVGSAGTFTSGQQAGTPLVSTTAYNGNVSPNAGATWITPQGGTKDTGYYIYQETFNIPAGATTLGLIGDVTADDYVEDIILNGTVIENYTFTQDSPTNTNFDKTPAQFSYTGGALTTGINTIDFIVPNTGGQTGLLADLSGTDNATAVVPEPSTVAVYMIGSLALLGFIVRKKRIS